MIDTVRLTTHLETTPEAKRFDQIVVSIDNRDGKQKQKWITIPRRDVVEPRVTYYPVEKCINVEVSLPKLLKGNNYEILNQLEIERSLDGVEEAIDYRMTKKLPDWRSWSVTRLDACYAWPVGDNMQAYLDAFTSAPVYGYVRSPYIQGDNRTQGFTWAAKSRRVNAYDKGLESNLSAAAGLLRLEVQNLNGRACATLAARLKFQNTAGNLLSVAVARSELERWQERSGIGKTVKSHTVVFEHLINEFGYSGACSRIAFLQLYSRFGSASMGLMGEATYKRRLAEAKKLGWLLESEKELPALEVGK